MADPKSTQPPSTNNVQQGILSNGCYGLIYTLKVPLPRVENLYTPFEGFFQKKYSEAASGMANPNSSLSEKIIFGALAAAVAPVSLVEGVGTAILNAPNAAARTGQNAAAAALSCDASDRVTHSLETVVSFSEAFTGIGGAVVLTPKLPLRAGSSGFVVLPKPAVKAKVPIEKFRDYIFKPDATHGKEKVFESLGYKASDSEALSNLYAKQGSERFAAGEYSLGKLDSYGQRVDIRIDLPGVGDAAGKMSSIKSGWMISTDGSISLNTPFSGFVK